MPVAGVEVPIVIGLGSLALGAALMLVAAKRFRAYFKRPPEAAGRSNVGAGAPAMESAHA